MEMGLSVVSHHLGSGYRAGEAHIHPSLSGILAAMGRKTALLWIRDAAAKFLKGWGEEGLCLGHGALTARPGMLMPRIIPWAEVGGGFSWVPLRSAPSDSDAGDPDTELAGADIFGAGDQHRGCGAGP